jgi:uncharacterized membrane protein
MQPTNTSLGTRLLLVAVVGAALALAGAGGPLDAESSHAAVIAPAAYPAQAAAPSSSASGNSLEAAATKAGDTGRKVAMSLIGLAFAVAAIVLAFKRDFKEAAGVLAVGMVAVLLATPAGLNVLRDTVSSLFGGQ